VMLRAALRDSVPPANNPAANPRSQEKRQVPIRKVAPFSL